MISWLLFSFPFVAITAPCSADAEMVAHDGRVLGILFVWLDVRHVAKFVIMFKRHRRRASRVDHENDQVDRVLAIPARYPRASEQPCWRMCS